MERASKPGPAGRLGYGDSPMRPKRSGPSGASGRAACPTGFSGSARFFFWDWEKRDESRSMI